MVVILGSINMVIIIIFFIDKIQMDLWQVHEVRMRAQGVGLGPFAIQYHKAPNGVRSDRRPGSGMGSGKQQIGAVVIQAIIGNVLLSIDIEQTTTSAVAVVVVVVIMWLGWCIRMILRLRTVRTCRRRRRH